MAYTKTSWKLGSVVTTDGLNNMENGLETIANSVSGSYVKTDWHDGDIINAAKLNKIEDGIKQLEIDIGKGYVSQTKSVTYNPSAQVQTETIIPDQGYNGLQKVNVSVNAISDNYVGTGIARRASSDVSINTSTSTVSVPSGYYESNVSKEIPTTVSDAVRFIDYDGTILYEYSVIEFLALTSLPENPAHTGLTSQGWNWSLEDAKEYVTKFGYLDIGQSYITTSGNTEIDITLSQGRLAPYLKIAVNGSVTVSWGDNSSNDVVNGSSTSSSLYIFHEYSEPGDYTISISVTSGKFAFRSDASSCGVLVKNSSSNEESIVYSSSITEIRGGSSFSIGYYAFCNCYSLKSIAIPNNVISVDGTSFYNCYSLKSITIPMGITSITNLWILFKYCYSLKRACLPKGIPYIGDGGLYSLERKITDSGIIINHKSKITINNTVTSINQGAYSNCFYGDFSDFSIPNSVTSISTDAFQNCYSLSSITIPNSVTFIGAYAFQNCFSLKSITLPDSVTSFGGSSIFSCCYSLKSITITNSITNNSIPSSVFTNCRNLKSITIPSNITTINSFAFEQCHSLSSITIPASVTSISANAFRNCRGLSEVHVKPNNPPTAGTTIFYNIPSDCVIYVPSASLNTYKEAAGWSTYASQMVGE